MSEQEDIFNGFLTPSMRRALQEKRLSLGLSFKQAGHLLGTDWSTVRNWENGRTRRCHPRHAVRLRGFIAGEYDMSAPPYAPGHVDTRNEMLSLPLGMQYCAGRLADACRICADDEPLRSRLIASVGRAISGCLRSLVE